MGAPLKIGLLSAGFGPGTGPATYAEAVRLGLSRHHLLCPTDGTCQDLDLIHVLDVKRANLKLLELLRLPVVLDFHDDYWTADPDYPTPDLPLRRLRRRRLYAHHLRALRSASAVVAHSQAVALSLAPIVAQLPAGPRPRPEVFLVPIGIDQSTWAAAEDAPGFAASDPLILLVGRDLFRKGFPVLVQALPLVRRIFPGAHALVVGREYVHTRIAARFLARRQPISFLPQQSPAELASLYRRAAVLVLPSRREAFGIVLLEAMAAGLPVVASRTGGIPEVVEEGVSGLLHEPGDAEDLADKIVRVVRDPILRHRLIAGGRERAAAGNVRRMIAALEEAYYRTLEAARCR